MTDYEELCAQLEELCKNVDWEISKLANASALIWEKLENLNWAGFYIVKNNELVLGPFQGKVACTLIKYGCGVCGTALKKNQTIVVKDVHKFEGHIACDSASNSEIVIPIHKNNSIYGVLDIDSPLFDRFSEIDRIGLEKYVSIIEKYL